VDSGFDLKFLKLQDIARLAANLTENTEIVLHGKIERNKSFYEPN